MKYILNKNRNILNLIKELSKNSNEIDIAVPFITFDAIQLLTELQNKKVRIITTIDDYITGPEVLSHCLNKFKNIRIIKDKINKYHGKIFIFKSINNTHIINGSLNITKDSFLNKLEIVTYENSHIKNNEALIHFEYLWEKSIEIDLNFIKNYSSEYSKHNKYKEKNFDNLEQKIMPIEMQKKALEKLKNHRKLDNKALIQSATGTGKTYLSAFDAMSLNSKRILFVVHLKTIIHSAIKSFKTIYQNDIKTINLADYNDYSINTVKTKKVQALFGTPITIKNKLINSNFSIDYFDYIIIDEAHHTKAKTYQDILNYFKPKFLLGMTATPERTDGEHAERYFGNKTVYKIDIDDAIRRKYLSEFNYFGITDSSKSNEDKITPHNANNKAKEIIKNLKKYSWFGKKLKALLFVGQDYKDSNNKNINQADLISKELNNLGRNSESIYGGKYSSELVYGKIEELENDNDELEIIVVKDMFNEGVDIPSLNVVIFMRSTESRIVWLQQLGRGLRKYNNKSLTVLDFIGNDTNEYKRIIDVKTNDKSMNEIIEDINKGKDILFNGMGISSLEPKAYKQIIHSLLNCKSNDNFINIKLENLKSQGINLINDNYEVFEEFKFDVIENSYLSKQKTIFSKICEICNVKLSDTDLKLIQIIHGIPFRIGDRDLKETYSNLLSGNSMEFNLNSKEWKLFSGKYNLEKYNNIFYSEKTNNVSGKITLKKFKSLLVNKEIKRVINFLNFQIKTNSFRWLNPGDKYLKREIVYITNNYDTLTLQSGQIDVSGTKNKIYLFNTLEKNFKNYNHSKYENKISNKKLIVHTKKNTKDFHVNLLKNNDLYIFNFIKDEIYAKKFDGERFLYLGEMNNYENIEPKFENTYSLEIPINSLRNLKDYYRLDLNSVNQI